MIVIIIKKLIVIKFDFYIKDISNIKINKKNQSN